MTKTQDQGVLEALLDSWNRNNTILLNLLRALPEDGLEARAMEGSPTIAVQFSHIHSTRLFFINQTAPAFAKDLAQLFRQDGENRLAERNLERIAVGLEASAKAVGDAVKIAVETGRDMKGTNVAYDHPVLLLQHLLWHEGYHVGQMMLGLKAMGQPMSEEQTEPAIWGVWRREEWDT
jgi:uncharacterized damage-inducible protein DinB